MTSEIPPSAPSPFQSGAPGTYEFLMRLVESHGGNLPPGFAATVMGYFFAMPQMFMGFGARAFQPMPEVNKMLKTIERALVLNQPEVLAKAFSPSNQPRTELARGVPMDAPKGEALPFFRVLARDFTLLQQAFAPDNNDHAGLKQQAGKQAAPQLKIAQLLEQTRLAADLLHSKESPQKSSHLFSQMEQFKENLSQFLEKLDKDFPQQKEIVQQLKKSLEPLEKALHLLRELKLLPEGSQTRVLDHQKEAQKALNDFMRQFQLPLSKSLEDKTLRRMPEMKHGVDAAPLKTPLTEKPQATSFAQLKFLPPPDAGNSAEKSMMQKIVSFLAGQEAALVKPNPTAVPPSSVVVPYQEFSINDPRRLLRSRRKEDKAGKREERPLSYSSDEDEEEDNK